MGRRAMDIVCQFGRLPVVVVVAATEVADTLVTAEGVATATVPAAARVVVLDGQVVVGVVLLAEALLVVGAGIVLQLVRRGDETFGLVGLLVAATVPDVVALIGLDVLGVVAEVDVGLGVGRVTVRIDHVVATGVGEVDVGLDSRLVEVHRTGVVDHDRVVLVDDDDVTTVVVVAGPVAVVPAAPGEVLGDVDHQFGRDEAGQAPTDRVDRDEHPVVVVVTPAHRVVPEVVSGVTGRPVGHRRDTRVPVVGTRIHLLGTPRRLLHADRTLLLRRRLRPTRRLVLRLRVHVASVVGLLPRLLCGRLLHAGSCRCRLGRGRRPDRIRPDPDLGDVAGRRGVAVVVHRVLRPGQVFAGLTEVAHVGGPEEAGVGVLERSAGRAVGVGAEQVIVAQQLALQVCQVTLQLPLAVVEGALGLGRFRRLALLALARVDENDRQNDQQDDAADDSQRPPHPRVRLGLRGRGRGRAHGGVAAGSGGRRLVGLELAHQVQNGVVEVAGLGVAQRLCGRVLRHGTGCGVRVQRGAAVARGHDHEHRRLAGLLRQRSGQRRCRVGCGVAGLGQRGHVDRVAGALQLGSQCVGLFLAPV